MTPLERTEVAKSRRNRLRREEAGGNPVAYSGFFSGCPEANLFSLTMLQQHSQYDSRLGFSFRVLVRVVFRVRIGVRIRVNLTLTKTLKVNPNLLSYWECCRNMVRKTFFAARNPPPATWLICHS